MAIDKEKVLFLMMAMTVPWHSERHYFYDSVTEMFFYSKPLGKGKLALYNFYEFPLSEREYADIAVRLELIDDDFYEITEIPRVNTQEKIDIQLNFLSHFEGVFQLKNLITAVKNQKDDYKMVLDTLLIKNDNTELMALYWNDFKLKTVITYASAFSKKMGLNISGI